MPYGCISAPFHAFLLVYGIFQNRGENILTTDSVRRIALGLRFHASGLMMRP